MLANKDTLIAKYLSGNSNPEEIKRLTEWLKQDPSHQAEFERVEKIWNTSLNLKKDKDADVESAWNEFRSLTESQPQLSTRKTNYSWLNMAAAVAVFVVSAIMVKLFTSEPLTAPKSQLSVVTVPEIQAGPETLANDSDVVSVDSTNATPAKPLEKRQKKAAFPSRTSVAMITVNAGDSAQIFMLPDNSIVYLNAKSKLEYPQNFNKTNRRVSLTGEAYFDIKKDSGQFVVACENTIIRGKGTTFNVKSHSTDKEVEVIVAAGSVEFSGIGYKDFKKLVIKTGESGYYNKAKSEIVKSKHQRKNYKWWQKKSLRARIKDFFDKLLGKKKQ